MPPGRLSKDRALLDRFRDEQVAGTTPAATQPAASKPSILSTVKVDGVIYLKPLGDDLLPSPFDEEFGKLTRAGNLLLIADRPRDAKIWLARAGSPLLQR